MDWTEAHPRRLADSTSSIRTERLTLSQPDVIIILDTFIRLEGPRADLLEALTHEVTHEEVMEELRPPAPPEEPEPVVVPRRAPLVSGLSYFIPGAELGDLQGRVEMEGLDKKITAYYDSIPEASMLEDSAWGAIGEAALAVDDAEENQPHRE